jgi:hypothetical protein
MEVSGQLHVDAALTPWKDFQISIRWKIGWSRSPSGHSSDGGKTIPASAKNRIQIVHQVASHFTDWAVPANYWAQKIIKNFSQNKRTLRKASDIFLFCDDNNRNLALMLGRIMDSKEMFLL